MSFSPFGPQIYLPEARVLQMGWNRRLSETSLKTYKWTSLLPRAAGSHLKMCFWLLATRKRLTRRPREIIEPLRSVFPSRNAGKRQLYIRSCIGSITQTEVMGRKTCFFGLQISIIPHTTWSTVLSSDQRFAKAYSRLSLAFSRSCEPGASFSPTSAERKEEGRN